jgi:hypothetical protein
LSYWQIEIQDVIVENKSVFSKVAKTAILDSGTSLITMPNEEYEKIIDIYHSKFRTSDSFGCQKDPELCYFRTKCKAVISKLKNLKF